MRYREEDDDLFYYDKFTNLKNIFNWIFKIEDIPKNKHVEYVSSKLIGHASRWWTNLQASLIQHEEIRFELSIA